MTPPSSYHELLLNFLDFVSDLIAVATLEFPARRVKGGDEWWSEVSAVIDQGSSFA